MIVGITEFKENNWNRVVVGTEPEGETDPTNVRFTHRKRDTKRGEYPLERASENFTQI